MLQIDPQEETNKQTNKKIPLKKNHFSLVCRSVDDPSDTEKVWFIKRKILLSFNKELWKQ